MLPADPTLRRCVLLAIGLVVVLPFGFIYGFVTAVNHVLLPLLESFGYGPYHGRVYVRPWLATAVVFGGLGVQAVYGPRTVLGSLGAQPVNPDAVRTSTSRSRGWPTRGATEPPAVAVAHNSAPNAAAVRGPADSPVVVTTGLIETLDDRERDAVLAHEIAHLKNRDATVLTVAWLLPTVTYYVALAATYMLYGIYRVLGAGSSSNRDGDGLAKAVIVLTVAAVVTLALSALFWAASGSSTGCSRGTASTRPTAAPRR